MSNRIKYIYYFNLFVILLICYLSSALLESTQSSQPTTETPSATFSPRTTPTVTQTPYELIFDGFINCRLQPSSSSNVVAVIMGQPITIIAQTENHDWLLVHIEDTDTRCWVPKELIPSLIQNEFQYTLHLGELAVSSVRNINWNATVVITIHNDSHKPVSGVIVNSNWGSCTTNQNGACMISLAQIPNNTKSITFEITNISAPSYIYISDDNDVSSQITINRP